jgi:hypothetical protein
MGGPVSTEIVTATGVSRRFPIWMNLICTFLLVTGVVQVLVFTGFEYWQIHIPFPNNLGEGHALWMAMQITNRHVAYQSTDHFPYIFYPYTPLYMVAVHLLNGGDLWMTGRWLSLVSTLALSCIAGLTVFASAPKAEERWRLAGAAATMGLILASKSVVKWTPLMRVDMMALMFSVAGLSAFILMRRRQAGLYIAMGFFLLSVFTKQVCIGAPAACLIAGLVDNWRATLRALGVAVALGLAGMAGCTWFYGKLFFSHTFLYNLAPYTPRHGLLAPMFHLIQGLPYVLIAVASARALAKRAAVPEAGWLAGLQARIQANILDRALFAGLLYFAITTAMLPLIGKRGSDVNYFLEWDVASALLAGLFVLKLVEAWKEEIVWKPSKVMTYLLVPCAIVLTMTYVDPGILAAVREPEETRNLPTAQAERVIEMIRATPNIVFTEDMLLSILGGKTPAIVVDGLNFMGMKGRWDERPFVEMIDRQQFGLIVSMDINNPDRYSPATTEAINRAYVLSERVGIYQIYRPRPKALASSGP